VQLPLALLSPVYAAPCEQQLGRAFTRTHARSATCWTGNLHGELLSGHEQPALSL